ncbi:g249 [Yersinia phage phiR1-37]|uniref:hypothetical protein n=1 Tax=Yersinia phage phiR1-37 TaxID=331278 RepID=UPI00022DBDA4|nr:hypothetical protein phiR1-37_gp249 [Yersinia phage phiR1-37]CCE26272.1 g249 [Yersinia phage phiR1-37]
MVTGIVPTFSNDAIHNSNTITLSHDETKYGLKLHVKYNTKYFKAGFMLPKGKYSISGNMNIYCLSKDHQFSQNDSSSFNKEIEVVEDLDVHKIESFWQNVFNTLPLLDQKIGVMQHRDSTGELTVHIDFELFSDNDMYLTTPLLRLQTTAK